MLVVYRSVLRTCMYNSRVGLLGGYCQVVMNPRRQARQREYTPTQEGAHHTTHRWSTTLSPGPHSSALLDEAPQLSGPVDPALHHIRRGHFAVVAAVGKGACCGFPPRNQYHRRGVALLRTARRCGVLHQLWVKVLLIECAGRRRV